MASLLSLHYELEKKLEYGDHIHVVDGECFTPLVFSTLSVSPLSCTWWKAGFQLKTLRLLLFSFAVLFIVMLSLIFLYIEHL